MRLLIFGTGGHAKSVVEAIVARGEDEVMGLINEDGSSVPFLDGYSVLGANEDALAIARERKADGAIVALGDAAVRRAIVESLEGKLLFPSVVHPAAWVSPSSTIGEGTVVFAGSVVGASTIIGRHCILNTRASVDHDCVIEDFVHVCPGVTLAGHVRIGEHSWIGVGSTVVDRVALPRETFVRAGSCVITPRVPLSALSAVAAVSRGARTTAGRP